MAETSTSAELIESDAHLASACEHFRELIQSPSIVADLVVGLDCEWRPPSGSVSVLQIATSTRCFIIRTQQCIASLPMLSELLANKSIVKVGVGVGDDAAKLNRDFGISVRGCVGARISPPRFRLFMKTRSFYISLFIAFRVACCQTCARSLRGANFRI